MKNKNQLSNLATDSLLSFAFLKLTQSKIDPYTRFTIGLLGGTALALSENQTTRYFGIGAMLVSVL